MRGDGEYGASWCRGLVALSAGALVLAGCGSDDHTAAHPARSGSPSARAAATVSAPPEAADGTDLGACADGRCEVRVSAPAKIPVPRSAQVSSVRVRSIGPDTVTIAGHFLGSHQGGFCTGRSCSSSGSNGGFTLTLGADSTGSENGLSIEAVAIDGEFAVLRLAPLSGH